MDDLISRQEAISHVDDVPYIKEHPNVGLLWKAWIESLPSVQPEIVRCRDCKYWTDKNSGYCDVWGEYISNEEFFCAYGERREDDGSD